jgi:hypothetical protein
MLDRRAVLAALAASAVPLHAHAQAFPSRAITIVVPYPPGEPIDSLARARISPASCSRPVALKTPMEMSAMLPGEIAKWATVVKAANVTVD